MHIIVKRTLKDYAAWKKVAGENTELRAGYGSRGLTAYQSAENPNEVTIVFDWDDAKPFEKFVNDPKVQRLTKDTGAGPSDVIPVKDVFTLPA